MPGVLLGVRSLLAFAFAVIFVVITPQSLEAMLLVLGPYLILDGVLLALLGTNTFKTSRWLLLAAAVVSVLIAFATLITPGPTAAALLWPAPPVIWAVTTGVLLLFAGRQAQHRLLAWLGLLSVALAVLLSFMPLPGIPPIGWTIVAYLLLVAVLCSTAYRKGRT